MAATQANQGARRAKGTLTKKEVVREAIALIDKQGADACSMRNVASRVGVTAMALYSYVPSRDALLNDACEAFLGSIEMRPRPGELWDDTLIRCMHALRHACLRHPNLAALTNHPAVGGGLEPFMVRLRSLFLAQGMPEDVAIQLTVAADAFFAGFMLRAKQLIDRQEAQPAKASGGRVAGGGAQPAHPADATKRLALTSRVPGMLTGRGRYDEPPALNERWRKTLSAGYSSQSFENGLVIIVEGVRACMDPDPCDWRTLR